MGCRGSLRDPPRSPDFFSLLQVDLEEKIILYIFEVEGGGPLILYWEKAGHVYMDVELTRYRAKRLQSPPSPLHYNGFVATTTRWLPWTCFHSSWWPWTCFHSSWRPWTCFHSSWRPWTCFPFRWLPWTCFPSRLQMNCLGCLGLGRWLANKLALTHPRLHVEQKTMSKTI